MVRPKGIRFRRIEVDPEVDLLNKQVESIFKGQAKAFELEMKLGRLSGPTTPESLSIVSGRLRAGVRARVRTTKTGRIINRAIEGLRSKTGKFQAADRFFQLSATIPATVHYAILHEEGTGRFPARLGFAKTFDKHARFLSKELEILAKLGKQIRVKI